MRLSQSLVTATAGVVLLAVAGCSGGLAQQGKPPASQQNSGLAKVDPCALLSSAQLSQFGLQAPGTPRSNISSEPGCDYDGGQFGLSVYKNQQMTVEKYGQQNNWAKFDRTQVAGRPGAQAIDKAATKAGACTTMFDAGGGVVVVDLSKIDNSVNECAESMKIAEVIAPSTPK